MINKVDKMLNRRNLLDVSEILNKNSIDYSVFYGTALGIQRNNDILDHDDDVDFIINSSKINEVKTILSSAGFSPSVFSHGIFLQMTRVLDGTLTYVDFYSYTQINEDTLMDMWNFRGIINSQKTHLYFDKSMLLPTKEHNFQNKIIRVPNDINLTCEFLYGTRYKETLIKGLDYIMEVKNNKPHISYLR